MHRARRFSRIQYNHHLLYNKGDKLFQNAIRKASGNATSDARLIILRIDCFLNASLLLDKSEFSFSLINLKMSHSETGREQRQVQLFLCFHADYCGVSCLILMLSSSIVSNHLYLSVSYCYELCYDPRTGQQMIINLMAHSGMFPCCTEILVNALSL